MGCPHAAVKALRAGFDRIMDALEKGFSNYVSRPHLGSKDLVLGSRNKFKTNWLYSSELKAFVALTGKLKIDLQKNDFVLHFMGNSTFTLSVVNYNICLSFQVKIIKKLKQVIHCYFLFVATY